MSIYSKLTQSQTLPATNNTCETVSVPKVKQQNRKDEFAELFSDEEERRKNADLIVENLKSIKDK